MYRPLSAAQMRNCLKMMDVSLPAQTVDKRGGLSRSIKNIGLLVLWSKEVQQALTAESVIPLKWVVGKNDSAAVVGHMLREDLVTVLYSTGGGHLSTIKTGVLDDWSEGGKGGLEDTPV